MNLKLTHKGIDSENEVVDKSYPHRPVVMLTADEAEDLLRYFPSVEFAFAYGSGVVEQGGYKYEQSDPSKLPMMDFILVVENSEQWHEANMLQNPSHYTSIIPLGSKYVAKFQDKVPARLWFNAYIPMKSKGCVGRLMKYGVINKEYMLEDLNTWSNLYTAGRLQKPVRVLKHNAEIEEAIKNNLESAVRTSLLMLPEKFEEIDLYLNIASLSYVGDPRMYFGENPKKVCPQYGLYYCALFAVDYSFMHHLCLFIPGGQPCHTDCAPLPTAVQKRSGVAVQLSTSDQNTTERQQQQHHEQHQVHSDVHLRAKQIPGESLGSMSRLAQYHSQDPGHQVSLHHIESVCVCVGPEKAVVFNTISECSH